MDELPRRAPLPPVPPVPAADVRLSVLVPAYNAAATLGEALEPVLTQRPPVAQVFVSDDGSEDETPAVLAGFREEAEALPDLDMITTDAFITRGAVREERTYYGTVEEPFRLLVAVRGG